MRKVTPKKHGKEIDMPTPDGQRKSDNLARFDFSNKKPEKDNKSLEVNQKQAPVQEQTTSPAQRDLQRPKFDFTKIDDNRSMKDK